MNKFLIAAIISVILVSGGFLAFRATSSTNTPGMSAHNMAMKGDSQPVAQSHRSYKLVEVSQPQTVSLNTPSQIKYKIQNDKGEILKDFETVHEKIMHFIIVRKDLTQFQHLHPDFNKNTGEYSVDVNFAANGPYRWFADFTPGASADNPMKLTVTLPNDIEVGDSRSYQAQPLVVDTNANKTLPDGYTITYSFPKEIKAQTEVTYSLKVQKGGKEVTDLQNYLGALGHSVVLKEDTLDFIHAHAGEVSSTGAMNHGAMQTGSTTKGPNIDFSTTFPEPGKYRIFTQFQHQNKVLTTDYVINASN